MAQSILAFDFGLKRIGVACSDESGSTQVLAAIPTNLFWEQLPHLVQTTHADQILVGLPRNLDGEDTAQTVLVREFADRLKTQSGLPVVLYDEAMSTERAREQLTGMNIRQQKQQIDSLAAQIILQDYLYAQ